MAKFVFHKGTDRYNGEKSINKHIEDGLITKSDAAIISEYVAERQATKHIKECRANKIVFILVGWRRFISVPYNELTAPEIYKGITALKHGVTFKGTPFKQNSIHDHITILKPFLFWMNDNGYTEIPERKIREISAPPTDYDTKDAEDLATKDEIIQLIESCINSRDRALIAVHYEIAARPSETAALRWKDIKFDDYGAEVRIKEEKKKHLGFTNRFAYLTWSREYLTQWKNDYHPGKPDPDAYVFVTFDTGHYFDYKQFCKVINRVKKRAGITKALTPHTFRTSRITHMINEGFSETIVKKIAWDNLSTTMIKTYTKLSDNDVKNEVLDKAGIIQKSETAPPIKPRTCYKCGTTNAPTAEYCQKCGEGLTDEAQARQVEKVDSILTDIEEDPRLKIINEKLAAFKAELLKELN